MNTSLPATRSATTAELRRRGVTPPAIRSIVSNGSIQRVSRGVYVAATASPIAADPHDEARRRHLDTAVALCRALPGAYLVGVTAAVCHGLPVLELPVRLEIARRPRLHTTRAEVAGRTAWDHDVVRPDDLGVAVQAPAAAVVEIAAHHGALAGLIVADSAARRELLGVDGAELTEAVQVWGRRRGACAARAVEALADARRESPLETRTAWDAHGAGVELEPQYVVRDAHGEWVATTDFRVKGTNVLLEVDGIGKYRAGTDFKNERVRHNQIEELGWIVVRVTHDDLVAGRFLPRVTATSTGNLGLHGQVQTCPCRPKLPVGRGGVGGRPAAREALHPASDAGAAGERAVARALGRPPGGDDLHLHAPGAPGAEARGFLGGEPTPAGRVVSGFGGHAASGAERRRRRRLRRVGRRDRLARLCQRRPVQRFGRLAHSPRPLETSRQSVALSALMGMLRSSSSERSSFGSRPNVVR